jgi:hypothetical protein
MSNDECIFGVRCEVLMQKLNEVNLEAIRSIPLHETKPRKVFLDHAYRRV